MTKFFITALLITTLSHCTSPLQAIQNSVQIEETLSFSDVQNEVKRKVSQYSAQRVLIVVDIDNTLLTSTSDLGGDIWYQWQRNSLNVKPSEEQKVSCLFEDSISLLYELAPMQLTENDIPDIIAQWQDQQVSVFALTSRSPINRAATERELTRAGIDLNKTAPGTELNKTPGIFEKLQREMSYMNGIMMTSGMNKGQMLHYILQRYKQHFDAIVFVDDSQKNIDNIYQAFKDDVGLDMTIYHYTKVEADRIKAQGSILTQAQADTMALQWQQLNQTLNSIFPARKSETCLRLN